MLGGGGDVYAVWILMLLLKASLLVIMSGKPSAAQRLTIVPQAVVDEKCEECPSYCDENGAEHGPVNCRLATVLAFCCNFGARLDCCSNETLMITSDIGDGFHCPAIGTFNRTVLSVCVPVGFVCFVTAVVLIIYQKVRRRRRRRRTSNNSHFDRRSTSNASCSTRGSRCSIDSHQFPQRRDSVSNSNNRQQQQQQQQSTVVMSPTNLEDSIRINDDVILRVLQTVNSVPPSAVGSASSTAETCFIIQSTVYPPPYTDERPPSYTDIFPS